MPQITTMSIRKTTTDVKEAREIEKHLEALELEYTLEGTGVFEDSEENAPIFAKGGLEITDIGYKYVTIIADGEKWKATPDENARSAGEIVFTITG